MSYDTLDDLGPIWRLTFDEAWASFQAGSFGIGAVLVDPSDDSIITVGRNRVAQTEPQERMLSGNKTAHAEMNAFASLTTLDAEGLHLYTTLEPCLMCAATAMQLKIARVHFVAADEFFAGLGELWSKHPVTASRQPAVSGPLPGGLARFARFLPLAFTLRHFPGRTSDLRARQAHPHLALVADGLDSDEEFQEILSSGTVSDAVAHLNL